MLEKAVTYTIADNQKLRVLQITDPHLFADPEAQLLGVNTAKSLAAVLNTVCASTSPTDLILATGDISQDYSSQSYRHFARAMSAMKSPCHYLPGNHDDPQVMREHLQGENMHGQKCILAGNWQIIMLDSTIRGNPGGHMSDAECVIIDAAIKANPDKYVLLVMHHNPVQTKCTWLDQHCMNNGEQFLERIAQYPQVKGLLWGHVHQAFDAEYQGKHNQIKLMSTPSTCIQFKAKSPYFALDALQPGYRLLELSPDGSIQSQVHRVPGENFFPDKDASGY